GWEFITQWLKMPEDKIWATVYLDDDQAVEIWKKIGVPEERIVRLGKEDNFWEIGLGPCGPCSEIYFDRGEEYGCGSPDCKPGCDCDRYLEFWNHVFTQFSRDEEGNYSNLEHPNIDTGMGLERMACIMQGVDSIFGIDTIRHILDGVVEKCGVKYEDGKAKTDVSIRIITDHLRSMVFMISDNITPSNEGRGYVLRRIIRRAIRHGKLLGIEGKFLVELSNKVIEVSGEAYPELVEKKAMIQTVIDREEEGFASTLNQGSAILKEYVDKLKAEHGDNLGDVKLLGEQIFKLYDTYGFPLELTQEILAEDGIKADVEGFKAHMQEQKEKARAGRKDTSGEAWKDADADLDLPETVFTGYEKLEDTATVLAIYKEGAEAEEAETYQNAIVYLNQSPFYAEGGGQATDTGIMFTEDTHVKVISVTKKNGLFAHKVLVEKGTLKKGDTVNCSVNVYTRNATARNHTATHLLQRALRAIVGTHVEQAGSSVNEEELRFDFSHFEALSAEQLEQVEMVVNQKIMEFLPVTTCEATMEEAQAMGAMALFGEKYGDKVRVVNAGDFSVELCGGTHVANTGQIGVFKIISESGVASGVRRITAVTGIGVLGKAVQAETTVKNIAETLKSNVSAVEQKAAAVVEELKATKKELEDFKKAAMGSEVDDMVNSAKEINGVKLVMKEFADYNINDLRGLSDDIKAQHKGVMMVFATVSGGKVTFLVSLTDDLLEKGLHAGKMIKEIAAACGGGGGGKADMAQAGAKDPSKISDAFAVAENLLA
ncbi:MAG: alanine--tRNA ligase, partial [Firmicutes bacterium]|nr:alanine--tRNA ligase [Bacillota bacterium]